MNSKTIPIIVILALITLPILSVLYTDYLWFQEINYVNVFLTMLYTKISIFSAVSAFAFLFLFLNIWIAIHNTSKKLDSIGRVINAKITIIGIVFEFIYFFI